MAFAGLSGFTGAILYLVVSFGTVSREIEVSTWLAAQICAAIMVIPLLLLSFSGNAEKDPAAIEKELFEAYEAGKHRRYALLFSVNGGAFAVVGLLFERRLVTAGLLTLRQIAIGMILFTAVMCFDILAFGLKMRFKTRPGKDFALNGGGLFAWPGWFVLGALWLLISTGWALAGTAKIQPCVPQETDNAGSEGANLGWSSPNPGHTDG